MTDFTNIIPELIATHGKLINTSEYKQLDYPQASSIPFIEYNGLIISTIVRENVIDSGNIGKKAGDIMDILSRKNTDIVPTDMEIILLCKFMADKLYNIYHLSIERKNIIISSLSNTVYNADYMAIPNRLSFLRFRNEDIVYKTTSELRTRNIQARIRLLDYLFLIKYIIRSSYANPDTTQELFDELDRYAENTTDLFTLMDIADIFLLNGKREKGNELLDRIREMERQLAPQLPRILEKNVTIYTDSQNVHTRSINQSILRICVNLIRKTQVTDFNMDIPRKILYEQFPQKRGLIDKVLFRIETDKSRFSLEHDTFSMYNVFSNLWVYISNHSYRDTLIPRLMEEMGEMHEYCSTGHLARLVSIIQGFTDDAELQLRISDKEQLQSKVYHFITKQLGSASDEINDSILDPNPILYFNFISEIISQKIQEYREDFNSDEFDNTLISILHSYTGHNIWKIRDNRVVYVWTNTIKPENGEVIRDIEEVRTNTNIPGNIGDRVTYPYIKFRSCIIT